MELPVGKPDLRETLARLAATAVVILTFVAIAAAWSLVTAINLVLLAVGGFLLARLAARFGPAIPVPRSLHKMRRAISYRRMAYDRPFQTRLGWTGDAEPGGSLPDARDVTPQGKFGGGLMTDTLTGLLIIVALIASAFRYGSPLGAFLLFGVLGLVGFALIMFIRWLRGH